MSDDDDDEDVIGGEDLAGGGNASTAAARQLKAVVERIERLEDDKRGIQEDIKEVYAEAKGNGYDVKALRKIIAERRADPEDRQEFESILDLYRHALGML